MSNIFSFSVLPFSELSDHCCISANIRINAEPQNKEDVIEPKSEGKINTVKVQYTYDRNRADMFKEYMRKDENLELLINLLSQPDVDQERIDNTISYLNEVISSAAQKSFPRKKMNNKNKDKKAKQGKTKIWFTKECMKYRRILRKHSRNLSYFPFDRNKWNIFSKARMDYKRACRKAEKQYRSSLTEQLTEVGMRDPEKFWGIIHKMNNWGNDYTEKTDRIKPDTWSNHFKKLLNTQSNINPNTSEGRQGTGDTFDPILDRRITIEEMREGLSELKSKKAPGPDGIPAECLRLFGETFENTLYTILRLIFSNCLYPSQWNSNYLKPIYKKGDVEDPDNYRGLAIGSAFAKLFSLILLKRLLKYIDENNLITKKQIGFMKGSRTSDHIFLLQTIIEKVVKKNKSKLYAAFIDFKKAYDTVDRSRLFERLKSVGINGFFFRNITSMYEKTKYSIKLKKGFLDPIDSNLGLKQGCPLSPMLFNVYIDDVENIFDDQCNPVELQNEKIHHFLYADDLVLLSHSAEGLQRSLNKLSEYAKYKCLTISTKKSKTMIFNPTGKHIKKQFTIEGKALESVNTFCYLGFDVKPSGTVKHAMNTLNEKAKKALRPLMCAIARFNIPAKTSIRLFHTFISPIILYNVENWGSMTDKKLENFTEIELFNDTNNSKADLTHRKLLKCILGVSRSCPNIAVYGETGEIPLSLKGFRLMLDYWKRLTDLPDESLAKRALKENVNIRTNWIRTIEKLVSTFNLLESCNTNNKQFKKTSKQNVQKYYKTSWTNKLALPDQTRLKVYQIIKKEFEPSKHLDLTQFELRQIISKIRCSDHNLEIEKGRHRNIPRGERICKSCEEGSIEDEEHFLMKCKAYQPMRVEHNIKADNVNDFLNAENQENLAKYLIRASKFRDNILGAI